MPTSEDQKIFECLRQSQARIDNKLDAASRRIQVQTELKKIRRELHEFQIDLLRARQRELQIQLLALKGNDGFMYLPSGVSAIKPAGRADTIEILVDESTARRLEDQRICIIARSLVPYFGIGHYPGPVCFWPLRFFWRDGPPGGVYTKGVWSTLGRSLVKGRTYGSFSPTVWIDDNKPANITCCPYAEPDMGCLCNDPAFASLTGVLFDP